MKKATFLLTLFLSIFMLSSCSSKEFNAEKADAAMQSINENGLNEKDLNDLLDQFEACTDLECKIRKELKESGSSDKGLIADLNYLSPYWSRMANQLCYKTKVEQDFPEIYKRACEIMEKSRSEY